jgi:F0F1-type ATP synthase assembly protein I
MQAERDRRRGGSASGDWRSSFRDAGPYVGLGMQLAFTMVVFTGVGHLVDRWLAALPWFTIGGALLGMVAVFVQLVRIAGTASKSSSAREARTKK